MGRGGSMSTTELDEVQALLERVLPDPAGFAQRLALQVMGRWGQPANPNVSTSNTAADQEDITAEGGLIWPDRPDLDDVPIDINVLLAMALGACECWGLSARCARCGGQGSTGWIRPDPELFEALVKPAIAKLPDISVES
jgi:hypothetical protein